MSLKNREVSVFEVFFSDIKLISKLMRQRLHSLAVHVTDAFAFCSKVHGNLDFGANWEGVIYKFNN